MNNNKYDIVCFDSDTAQVLDDFIARYNLTYDTAYNRAEDHNEYNGIEMSEKLLTMLLLLENNWHIERVDTARGEV